MSHSIITGLLLLQTFLFTHIALAQESTESAASRHRRVAQRKAGIHIICHRGAIEFAHENTLEAYRAAFELGADGNEIDIRATKDGVLVCFHDDMLDHLLNAYGDVSDYTWHDLQQLPFRNPGQFGKYCRIPTLREVFELHRDHAGLMHLDVKRPGLVEPISQLLDELDLWDHVVQAPAEFTDTRIQPTPGKAGLYLDRTEVDAAAIAAALKRPGNRIILEDPRGVAFALGRRSRLPANKPVKNIVADWAQPSAAHRSPDKRADSELLDVLRAADDWNIVATGDAAAEKSATRILQRAQTADELARRDIRNNEIYQALAERVRHRSLHADWRYCGLDGSAALRSLISLQAPQAVDVARFCLWRNDPAVKAAQNPKYTNPSSWTDWRTKIPVFPLLKSLPGANTEQLCRDYLALSEDEARQIGIPQFEPAARTLLTISPQATTVQELLKHPHSVVRGRAILFCLARADQPWAKKTLSEFAPHALDYVLSDHIRIALIGDSTVASYPKPPADRPDLTGWGQVFGEFFTDRVEVFNHARSGRSSKSFVREGHWTKTLAVKPDYVFIQFGHNDGPTKGDRATDPNGDFRDYLRQYIRETRQINARPILVTPMTRRRFQDGKISSTLGPWAGAMREVGRQEQVPVVDLHAASIRLLNQLGDAGSADFSPSTSDRTHFSRKGALAMAGLVAAALRDVEPRLAKFLKTKQTNKL